MITGRWIRRPPLVGAALDRVLEARLEWSTDTLAEWARDQLRRRLELAARLPVYRGAGPDLGSFPLLSRESLGGDPDAFVDPRWPRGLLRSVATSGSSGRPIRFWRDPLSALLEDAFLRRQLRAFGVAGEALAIRAEGPRDGAPRIDRAPTRPEWRLAASRVDDEAVRQVVRLLEDRSIRLVRAYPSAAVELVRRAEVLGLGDRLRAAPVEVVHLSSETVTPEARRRIADGWGARVAEQYGLAERALLAQSCPAGSLHLITDYAHGEVVDGEWVGTPLFGGGAVLVRYRTGDLAGAPEDDGLPCVCGWPFPRIGRVDGRRDAVITTSDGRRVGRLGPALRGVEGLDQVQAEWRPGRVLLRFVAEPHAEGVRERLGRSVAELLQDPGTEIELVESPPLRGPGGRVRAVIRGD